MDLNKDDQNIYTVDSESYKEYVREDTQESRDFLGSFIKLLLLILLLIITYFFYKIVKADLSFSEVFNKQELFATYKAISNDEPIHIEEKDTVGVLIEKMAVLPVSNKYDESTLGEKEEVGEEMRVETVQRVKEKVLNVVKVETNDTSLLTSEYISKMNKAMDSI